MKVFTPGIFVATIALLATTGDCIAQRPRTLTEARGIVSQLEQWAAGKSVDELRVAREIADEVVRLDSASRNVVYTTEYESSLLDLAETLLKAMKTDDQSGVLLLMNAVLTDLRGKNDAVTVYWLTPYSTESQPVLVRRLIMEVDVEVRTRTADRDVHGLAVRCVSKIARLLGRPAITFGRLSSPSSHRLVPGRYHCEAGTMNPQGQLRVRAAGEYMILDQRMTIELGVVE